MTIPIYFKNSLESKAEVAAAVAAAAAEATQVGEPQAMEEQTELISAEQGTTQAAAAETAWAFYSWCAIFESLQQVSRKKPVSVNQRYIFTVRGETLFGNSWLTFSLNLKAFFN